MLQLLFNINKIYYKCKKKYLKDPKLALKLMKLHGITDETIIEFLKKNPDKIKEIRDSINKSDHKNKKEILKKFNNIISNKIDESFIAASLAVIVTSFSMVGVTQILIEADRKSTIASFEEMIYVCDNPKKKKNYSKNMNVIWS